MMRTVFMGSDAIALPWLNWLADEARGLVTVVAVYTQPDRAVGRGQKVQPNAIKLWAEARGLPVHQPEKLTPEELDRLKAVQPDLVLIMAYGHILRQDYIGAPRLGTLNLHTSLLPKYRGASPIQTAIARGDRQTGVTLMRIVPALDAGPIADPNHAGQTITDPLFQSGYSNFCYQLPFMPGQTGYFDTPVVPTSAFAGDYNTPDCAYPDATPAVSEVDGDGVGPWVSAANHSLTITCTPVRRQRPLPTTCRECRVTTASSRVALRQPPAAQPATPPPASPSAASRPRLSIGPTHQSHSMCPAACPRAAFNSSRSTAAPMRSAANW